MDNLMEEHMGMQIVLLAFLCFAAFRLKWLTLSGAIAAFITALILAADDLRNFTIPLFLLTGGSLLSRLNNEVKEKEGRNAQQVMANGLIGLCCLLISYSHMGNMPKGIFFNAFLLSFFISICDTFSSEIGRYYKGRTIDIISGKAVLQGLSGGISLPGTLGGLLAIVICAIAVDLIYTIDFFTLFILAIMGFSGMLLDSVLGSLLQVKYRAENGDITEVATPGSQILSGYAWCNNDMVNLLSNFITVCIYLIAGWMLM